MREFLAPNIGTAGRLVRGLMGLALLVGAVISFRQSVWLALVLAGAGVFGLFEAFRGWCLMRACGIRTKL